MEGSGGLTVDVDCENVPSAFLPSLPCRHPLTVKSLAPMLTERLSSASLDPISAVIAVERSQTMQDRTGKEPDRIGSRTRQPPKGSAPTGPLEISVSDPLISSGRYRNHAD
jgi:hypothetical protein